MSDLDNGTLLLSVKTLTGRPPAISHIHVKTRVSVYVTSRAGQWKVSSEIAVHITLRCVPSRNTTSPIIGDNPKYHVFFALQLLRLSKAGANNAATGRIVNLMSNDVCRFDYTPQNMGFLIITPLQGVIITYILWTIVGPSSVVGVGFILLQTMPVQSKWTGRSPDPCSTGLKEQLTAALIPQKFQANYKTQIFIFVFSGSYYEPI